MNMKILLSAVLYGFWLLQTNASLYRSKRAASSWIRSLTNSQIKTYPDGECVIEESDVYGTCYTSFECSVKGGYAPAICPDSNKVCCVFVGQIYKPVSESKIYLQNSKFPRSNSLQELYPISYLIQTKNSNICQFRLDLIEFDLSPPMSGDCGKETFSISGQNENSFFPKLCGLNSGQTVYVDVPKSENDAPVVVNMLMTFEGSYDRKWNIKVSQISCDDPDKAPANCLQYHKDESGTIKSFNYDFNGREMADRTGYLNNMRYSICFHREPDFCDMIFSNPEEDFSIAGSNLQQGEGGTGREECDSDYIVLANRRLCGDVLNEKPEVADPKNESAPMINPVHNELVIDKTNGPFIVEFVSNESINGRGFNINYQQLKCNIQGL